jgi:hypothetical protein
MLTPAEVADVTGVDGWEVTRVEPHETQADRAKCFYEADDAIVVILRAAVDDPFGRLFDTTVACEDDTLTDGPTDDGRERSYSCLVDGEPIAATTVDNQIVIFEYHNDDLSVDERHDVMADLVSALF